MARRRTVQVRESIEELQQLRAYYAGTPNAALMQLLLLLREDHSRTIAECAEICKISVRKAERLWKKYREGGMSGAMSRSYSGARPLSPVSKYEDDKVFTTPAVLNAVGEILENDDVCDAIKALRELLYRICPSVDYIAIRMSMISDLDNRRLRDFRHQRLDIIKKRLHQLGFFSRRDGEFFLFGLTAAGTDDAGLLKDIVYG